jgi:predicted O-methyltransferase YrrM
VASTLRSAPVRRVLARLAAMGEAEDAAARRRVRAREEELDSKVYGAERAELYGGAPIAIAREVGELLFVLATGRRASTLVEFGASLGVSTIYLAAALRDAGGGALISTELRPDKAELARANLVEAGLDDLVELRVGDARNTLRDLPGDVDLLFLDGWNDLYIPVLELVGARLRTGALVVADLSADDPNCLAYREHVHDARHVRLDRPPARRGGDDLGPDDAYLIWS